MALRHVPLVLVFLLPWPIACGGVVIDERGHDGSFDDANGVPDTTDAPADGAQQETAPVVGDEAWDPHVGPHCVSDCAAWIDQCAFDQICVEPHATCAGQEAERVKDLVACVCAGCAERCGGSCVMFDGADPECLECQQTMVMQTCGYEYYECVGF